MTEKEKLAELEDIMELDEGTLSPQDRLDSYNEWDSLTALSLISLIDERFGKTVTGDDIKKLVTVADALALMEK